jgi:hypothetical protein
MSRSILSILESVLSKCTSSAVAASAGAALIAVALSTAGAFEAEAGHGVPSIASVTVMILRFLAQLPSSLSNAPSSSKKASSDVAPVDLA